jgi:steroid delta-isomerase-like uncharacterized protein
MGSKNVQRALATYEAINRRNLDAVAAAYAPDAVLTDHPNGETAKGPAEIAAYLSQFVAAMSDLRFTVSEAIDAGDTVVIQATGEGTQDGALGPFPASGRRATVPICNVIRYNADGQIVTDEVYWDQLSFLVQLGHIEPPTQ